MCLFSIATCMPRMTLSASTINEMRRAVAMNGIYIYNSSIAWQNSMKWCCFIECNAIVCENAVIDQCNNNPQNTCLTLIHVHVFLYDQGIYVSNVNDMSSDEAMIQCQ